MLGGENNGWHLAWRCQSKWGQDQERLDHDSTDLTAISLKRSLEIQMHRGRKKRNGTEGSELCRSTRSIRRMSSYRRENGWRLIEDGVR